LISKLTKAESFMPPIGKVSFEPNKIVDNAREFISIVNKLKPAAAKGTYIRSVFISSTMSPGVKIDPKGL